MPAESFIPVESQKGRISATHWLAIVIASLTLGAAAVAAIQYFLALPPTYPSFIVGAITWDAATKLQDLASYPVFLIVTLGSALAMQRQIYAAKEQSTALTTSLLWWCVPAALCVGSLLQRPESGLFPLAITAVGTFTLTVGFWLADHRGRVNPEVLSLAILAAILLALSPYGLAAIHDRFGLFGGDSSWTAVPRIALVLLLAAVGAILALCYRFPSSVRRVLPITLLVAQLGISPFFLLLYPDLLVGNEPAIPTTIWLKLLVITLSLAAVADAGWRYARFGRDGTEIPYKCLSPLAIFATLILLRLGQTLTPHISPDDYHFGESLLGWWSVVEFGKIPYVDFISPHGIFADDLSGYLSLIFYDGTAASIQEADRLATAITLLVAFIALYFYSGSLGVAYVSMLLFGLIARKLFFLLLAPVLCIWLAARRPEQSRNWLIMWAITSPLLLLAVPPQGLLVIVASLPIVAFLLIERRMTWNRGWLFVLGSLLAALAITPVLSMLWGALRYVIENGPINQIAYGIPWRWSWGGERLDRSLLELLRMSWIAIPLAAAALCVRYFRQVEMREYIFTVAVPILILASLLTPYSLGRIDPGSPSRAGLLSSFAWAVLMPLLLVPLLAARGRAVLAIVTAFMCASIGLADINRSALSDLLVTNRLGTLQNPSSGSIKSLGMALADAGHIDRLMRIKNVLDTHLGPKEKYLDLTGRNAQYFYFDREPPIAVTAPYNLAPLPQQRRAVVDLGKSLPPLALMEASNQNQDGGGLPLRAPILYRFVLDHYDAELHDGFIFGVARGSRLTKSPLTFTVKDLTDANWEKGVSRSDAAVVVNDSRTLQHLRVDDKLILPNGDVRRVTRVWQEGAAVWLSGSPLSPSAFPLTQRAGVVFDDARRQQLSVALMENAFAVADLRKIPVAWGRSYYSLSKRMDQATNLDMSAAELHDLRRDGTNLTVAGQDPFFWFDLQSHNFSGASVDLLAFDFSCVGEQSSPRLQVFWWGDGQTGAEERRSLRLTAENGKLIVPLDVHPSWGALNNVKGLRVDLDSPGACRAMTFGSVALHRRADR